MAGSIRRCGERAQSTRQGLPPPPRGYFYVRSDRDVFLVLETTRTIIDAFILLELLGR